jgi:hypothetical protein
MGHFGGGALRRSCHSGLGGSIQAVGEEYPGRLRAFRSPDCSGEPVVHSSRKVEGDVWSPSPSPRLPLYQVAFGRRQDIAIEYGRVTARSVRPRLVKFELAGRIEDNSAMVPHDHTRIDL